MKFTQDKLFDRWNKITRLSDDVKNNKFWIGWKKNEA